MQMAGLCLADFFERQHISLSYLEQLLLNYVKGGFSQKSVRGPGGGYQLGLQIEQISVGMIIAAVNENIHVTKKSGA